jgi:L-aspartate oxidase
MKYNVDITTDLIPVRPAAHYAMGGVRTDLDGRTSLPGLYAAGEAAGAGVHGANRLASNSLLEGLVYGARAGIAMREEQGNPGTARPRKPAASAKSAVAKTVAKPASNPGHNPAEAEALIHSVQLLMWKNAGIVRDGRRLREAVAELEEWQESLPPRTSRRACEAVNLHQVATLIARSALAREESRGAHYRTDFPLRNDARFQKHSVLSKNGIRFE